MIGADGSRSNVRTSLGIPLEGPRTENAFVIVDTAEDPDDPLPVERIFHYEHPAVDGRNVLFVFSLLILLFALWSANPHAKILGISWVVVGLGVAAYLKASGRSMTQSDL